MNQFKKPLLLTMGLAAFACAPVVFAQPYAYVPNYTGNSVTVINTANNSITTSIPVGTAPAGVAVNAAGSRAYVVNRTSRTVSVIDTGSNTVVATIPVGTSPLGIAISPSGATAYVANAGSNTVSVINTTTDTVSATIPVGLLPQGVSVDPQGEFAYVSNLNSDTVSVIDLGTNVVVATVAVGDGPQGVDVDSSGTSVYVGNSLAGTVSVIDTASNVVTDTITVGAGPYSVETSPSGAYVYVGNFNGASLSVIATATKSVTATIPLTGGPRALGFNPAGTFLYAATQSNQRVAVINTTTKTIASSIPVGSPRAFGPMIAQPLYGQGSIGAGHNHTCRVRADNSAHCWGRDFAGAATAPAGEFLQVVAGSAHSCGLLTNGTATCWGDNSFGQASAPGGVFVQLTAGFRFTCGLRADGSAECWGQNDQGQATPPPGTFAHLSGGSSHACGLLTNGSAQCWGRAVEGQTAAVPGNYVQLALGASFSCGLGADGEVDCWGLNTEGQATPPAGPFSQIVAEAGYVCGLGNDGQISCWGTNATGQTTPPPGAFSQLASGRFHGCALEQTGYMECWGENNYGQAPRFALTPGGLPNGQVAQPYSQAIAFTTINGGDDPYVLDNPIFFAEGALPAGLTLSPAGVLSGTPTTQGVYNFTVFAEDANGFHAEQAFSVTISLSAPIITPVVNGTAGTNGWYIGNVSVSWTVVDPETPVTSTSGCGTVVQSANTAGVTFTCTATSSGGTASESVTIKLDKVKPTLAPVVSQNKPLINDGTVIATPFGADALSGLASASCAAVDTSSVGTKQVNCTATDVAGNTYVRPVGYRVIYGFVGFSAGVVNPGLWNSALVNQPINFDYRLVDANGNGVVGAQTPTFTSTALGCPTSIANVTTPSADPIGLQDLGNGYYRFVWAAPAAPACIRLTLNTGDGQTDRRAVFQIQ